MDGQSSDCLMQLDIEKEVPLAGLSVLLSVSQWSDQEDWTCPENSYVICQRLSEGHSPLRMVTDDTVTLEVYSQVRSLGFMPARRAITIYPLEVPFRTLNCFFDKQKFEEATEIDFDGWNDRVGCFMSLSNRTVETMMRTIYKELVEPGFGSAQMIEAASTMMAVEMARIGQTATRAPSILALGNQGLVPWQLRRIRERINSAALDGYPSIEELAQVCGISRSHLMRMFKASTGQPLQRFIMLERLNQARLMLADDHLSIKQISAHLGFCNKAHFSNAFRRQEGISPSDFRKLEKAGIHDRQPLFSASNQLH